MVNRTKGWRSNHESQCAGFCEFRPGAGFGRESMKLLRIDVLPTESSKAAYYVSNANPILCFRLRVGDCSKYGVRQIGHLIKRERPLPTPLVPFILLALGGIVNQTVSQVWALLQDATGEGRGFHSLQDKALRQRPMPDSQKMARPAVG